MWELYDELIAGIPGDVEVEDFIVGRTWTMVKARGSVGLCLTMGEVGRGMSYGGRIIGDSLKAVAECAKSWNPLDSSLGVAAINCHYNSPAMVASAGGFEGAGNPADGPEGRRKKEAFAALASQAAGKKVAVAGRFPHLQSKLSAASEIAVFERQPGPGEYPDSAFEYVLPEADVVVITGMALAEKTLPRLLRLVARGARVALVGPVVPMATRLYGYGVTDLYSFCATDVSKAEHFVRRGDKMSVFESGVMVGASVKGADG